MKKEIDHEKEKLLECFRIMMDLSDGKIQKSNPMDFKFTLHNCLILLQVTNEYFYPELDNIVERRNRVIKIQDLEKRKKEIEDELKRAIADNGDLPF